MAFFILSHFTRNRIRASRPVWGKGDCGWVLWQLDAELPSCAQLPVCILERILSPLGRTITRLFWDKANSQELMDWPRDLIEPFPTELISTQLIFWLVFFFFFFGFIMCISREAPFFKGTLDAKSSSSHPKALLRRRNVTRTQEVNYFSSLCNTMAKVTVKSQTRSSLLCLLFWEAATNSLLHVVTKERHREISRFMDLGTWRKH